MRGGVRDWNSGPGPAQARTVGIVSHVERFDIPRVVVDEYRLAKVHLREPALVLGGEVCPEGHIGELPLGWILCNFGGQEVHRLLIADARKRFAYERVQPRGELLVHEAAAEELKVPSAGAPRLAHNVLDVQLRVVHDVLQVREGHLRLDHVELGEMALGLGVLRAERGPCACVGAGVTRHGPQGHRTRCSLRSPKVYTLPSAQA